MNHDKFKKLYLMLGKIGIMVPMVTMINCGVKGMDLLHTRAGRAWMDRTPSRQQHIAAYNIGEINRELQKTFGKMLSLPGIDCAVVEYTDGLMVLEVRRVVEWTSLNHFESSI